MQQFREHIWKPRCSLNAEKEKRLGITASEKRFKTPHHNQRNNNRSHADVAGQYQVLLERWKTNWEMAQTEMARFVLLGSNGFNHGWGLVKHSVCNLSSHL
jgi:hypothetical protein